MLFEARMIVKYDNLVNDVLQTQGRNQSLGRRQHVDLEPVRSEAHSRHSVPMVEENFDDFDGNFPIKRQPRVEQLEWDIRKDIDFKFRL